MYRQSSNLRHKDQASVTIQVAGEDEPFDAIVFLALGDRLIDLLNDDRAFIPVRRPDGSTLILAKTQIVSIVELASAADAFDIIEEMLPEPELEPEPEPDPEPEENPKAEETVQRPPLRRFDPYTFLKVEPDAPIEEIRAAYKSRIKAVHPDSVAALGLDEELTQAALKATQKLNYAYRKIMREREEAAAQEKETEDA